MRMSRGMSRAGKGGTKRARTPSKASRRASSPESTVPTRTWSDCRSPACTNCSERFQVLGDIVHLRRRQVKIERVVVVLHDGEQRRESTVVIKAALLVRPRALERRRAIAMIRRAIRLEVVDADFRAGVHRPARFAEERRHVTARAARSAVKERFAACGRGPIEAPFRRRGRWNRQL